MLVSIGIINFNNEKYLERAIRSCQNQYRSSQNLELIVVDDNSTDNSVDLMQQFEGSITIFRNSQNMGAGYSSQRSLLESSGKYFMRVDSDDYISQLTTALFTSFLEENPMYDFVFGNLMKVDSLGRKIGKIDMSNQDNLINHGAGIMFRRAKLLEIGGYNSELRHGEDIDLMLRILRNRIKGMHFPVSLYRYYFHGSNKSQSMEHEKAKVDLRRKYEL